MTPKRLSTCRTVLGSTVAFGSCDRSLIYRVACLLPKEVTRHICSAANFARSVGRSHRCAHYLPSLRIPRLRGEPWFSRSRSEHCLSPEGEFRSPWRSRDTAGSVIPSGGWPKPSTFRSGVNPWFASPTSDLTEVASASLKDTQWESDDTLSGVQFLSTK